MEKGNNNQSDILVSLYEEMKPICIEAKVPEWRYDKILDNINLLPEFQKFKENEYKEAKRIKDLLPEYVWQNYKTFQFKGFAEQKLLNEAFNKIRIFFKRLFPDPKKESSSEKQEQDQGN